MTKSSRILSVLTALALSALPAAAVSYQVGDTLNLSAQTVSPSKTVKISAPGIGTSNVLAGVVQLSIQTIGNVEALCIDPFQWASRTTSQYKVTALDEAKIPALALGADKANLIGKLWALYFDDARTNANTAAGLQIAVWMVVGSGNGFSLLSGSDYGAATMKATAESSSVSAAKLVALTSSSKQDFVVRQVPDGGTTVLLLGLGLTGLALIRRRI